MTTTTEQIKSMAIHNQLDIYKKQLVAQHGKTLTLEKFINQYVQKQDSVIAEQQAEIKDLTDKNAFLTNCFKAYEARDLVNKQEASQERKQWKEYEERINQQVMEYESKIKQLIAEHEKEMGALVERVLMERVAALEKREYVIQNILPEMVVQNNVPEQQPPVVQNNVQPSQVVVHQMPPLPTNETKIATDASGKQVRIDILRSPMNLEVPEAESEPGESKDDEV